MKGRVAPFVRTYGMRISVGLIFLAGLIAALWYYLENPSNQTFGNTVTDVPVRERVVSLTFDDGPNPPYTDQIVAYLSAQHVTATFFVIGDEVRRHPDSFRREVAGGFEIGNHTWDHPHLVVLSRAHIRRELRMTEAEIWRVGHVHTSLFRPPFGQRDFRVMDEAHRAGYAIVMWDVPLPRDWQNPPPAVIADRVMKSVRPGSIIVLHDGNRDRAGDRRNTVAATKLIVQRLRAQGYHFVTVSTLLRMGYVEAHPRLSPAEVE